MADIVLSTVDLDVFGGPTSLDVSVDFGKTGQRGSKTWAGNGDPTTALSGQNVLIGDLYINNDQADLYYGYIYQYIETPGNPAWERLYSVIGPQAPTLPTFSMQGNVGLLTGKQRFYPDRSCSISKVRASIGTASSSGSVVVQVYKNGTSVATATIAQGTNTILVSSLSVALTTSDYLTVSVTSAGTGATDLTVEISII